jgi:hypothetical protein
MSIHHDGGLKAYLINSVVVTVEVAVSVLSDWLTSTVVVDDIASGVIVFVTVEAGKNEVVDLISPGTVADCVIVGVPPTAVMSLVEPGTGTTTVEVVVTVSLFAVFVQGAPETVTIAVLPDPVAVMV